MLDRLIILAATLPFVVLGLIATFWTRRLREFLIRPCDRHPEAIHWRLTSRRVQSDWYAVELRLIGIVCLAISAMWWWSILFNQ
jgi:hypothetical protein